MREDIRAADAAADETHCHVVGISPHGGNNGNAGNDKLRIHRLVSQERQGSTQDEGEKPDQIPGFPEKPYPYSDILHRRRASVRGTANAQFLANRHGSSLWTDHNRPIRALIVADAAFGWIEPRSLLNNLNSWTFNALSDIKKNAPFPNLEFHSDNVD
jgi:hypothetical protein